MTALATTESTEMFGSVKRGWAWERGPTVRTLDARRQRIETLSG
jgi:hypothetical protein